MVDLCRGDGRCRRDLVRLAIVGGGDRCGDGDQHGGRRIGGNGCPCHAGETGGRSGAGLGRICDHGDGCCRVLRLSRAGGGGVDLSDLAERKAAARKAAFARRKAAHEGHGPGRAGHLSEVLAGYRGVPLAGFLPIRTEISPLAAMEEAAAHGPVGVPVIIAAGQPLKFSIWTPGCALTDGPFGAQVPVVDDFF